VWISKSGLLAVPIQQPFTTPRQFVIEQAGDPIDRRHGFGLRLAQSGFQHIGHTAQPELS